MHGGSQYKQLLKDSRWLAAALSNKRGRPLFLSFALIKFIYRLYFFSVEMQILIIKIRLFLMKRAHLFPLLDRIRMFFGISL